jgi:hypothetical protein
MKAFLFDGLACHHMLYAGIADISDDAPSTKLVSMISFAQADMSKKEPFFLQCKNWSTQH